MRDNKAFWYFCFFSLFLFASFFHVELAQADNRGFIAGSSSWRPNCNRGANVTNNVQINNYYIGARRYPNNSYYNNYGRHPSGPYYDAMRRGYAPGYGTSFPVPQPFKPGVWPNNYYSGWNRR